MNLRDPFRFRTLVKKATTPSSRPSVRVLQVITLESQKSRLPQMAAALSYRTVFGLLPMIIVALVALRFFVSDKQIDHFVTQALSYAGLEAIALDPPSVELPSEGAPQDEGAFFEEPETETDPAPTPPPAPVPLEATPAPTQTASTGDKPVVTPEDVSRSELADTVRTLIARAKQIDYRAIGLIGALTLIYAAISMLTEIERSFNQIFRVPVGKPWRRRILEYWAILTLGTPCLVATFFVGERAKAIVERAVEVAGLSSSGAAGIVLSGYAITVAISAALLLLTYTVLPNTRVRLVPALAGALLAAVLWEAGKWGFTQYLRYSTSYAKLYGSIALIPLFLLWIYATWGIVLFGLHVTYHIQQARLAKEGKGGTAPPIDWSDPPAGVVDPGTAVAVVHAAARGFQAGKPLSLMGAVEATRAQGSVVNEIVTRLVEAGLLYRVTVSDDPNHIALAQAPERISVRSVLEIGYDMAGPTGQDGGGGGGGGGGGVTPGVRAKLRDAHLEAAGDTTIADLLGGAQAPSPPPIPLAFPLAAPVANKIQPETGTGSAANLYPPQPAPPGALPAPPGSEAAARPASDGEDTVPSDLEGGSARDQESAPNGVGDSHTARRALHDPGVLHPDR